MRIRSTCALWLIFVCATVACAQDEGGTTPTGEATTSATSKPESLNDRVSYVVGVNMGRNFKQQNVEINLDLILQGIKDAMAEGDLMLTDEEMNTAMTDFQKQLQEKQAAAGEQSKTDGAAFLAENAKREGVVTLESGLQYEVIEAGSGPVPTSSDRVTVHYTGTLIDGTKFDSSHDRGQPATFPVTGVIAGWTEALQLMKVGAKWKLFIPSQLAYGERGTPGGPIGPHSALIFDVELIKIGE